MRKLVFVVNDASYFLSHRLDLALALLNSGWDVSVAVPKGSEGRLICRIESVGVRVCGYKFFRGGLNPIKEIATIFSLLFLFFKLRPDVVHSLTVKPVLYAGIAARLARVPKRISAFLGLGYLFYSPERRACFIRKILLPFFRFSLGGHNSYFIFQNPDDFKEMVGAKIVSQKNARNARIILGSGVDPDKYKSSNELYPEVVLFAGRLTKAKGVEEFFEAAKILKQKGVSARFVICGGVDKSNPEAISDAQIRCWVNSGYIEWLGHRSDIVEIISTSSIVSLPSRYGEGVPKILIEAAACSRPIVTTNAPGCREIVENGVNGFLVPVQDSLALASAIERLLSSPELRREMGLEGRKKAETVFSIETVIRQTLDVYEL